MKLCVAVSVATLVLMEMCLLSTGLPGNSAKFEEIQPAEMVEIDGHEYYISENPTVSVIDAIKGCNNLGKTLLSMQTVEKNKLIKDFLNTTHSGRSFWTSGTKFMENWMWSSTGELFTYEDWISTDPNYPGPETEVCMWFTSSWAWRDDPCSKTQAYICE